MEAYLDNSATTPVCPEAIKAINQTLTECWGNPSSLHYGGIEAADMVAVHTGKGCAQLARISLIGGSENGMLYILLFAERFDEDAELFRAVAVSRRGIEYEYMYYFHGFPRLYSMRYDEIR